MVGLPPILKVGIVPLFMRWRHWPGLWPIHAAICANPVNRSQSMAGRRVGLEETMGSLLTVDVSISAEEIADACYC